MKSYVVVSVGEDGDCYITQMLADELTERLNENHWGKDVTFLATFPKRTVNLQENGVGIYIIEGDYIKPRPKQVITAYELD
jgi:hypothetical protein